MDPLMPIGVFARATRLSIRALRNYDRLGLLSPARVDPDSGYRRYAVGQFPRAGLIRRLRELEVPLSDIAEILAAQAPEEVHAAVERHRVRVTAKAARLNRIAEVLGTVLDDPARTSGWLHVYERRRDAQPTARIVLRTALGALADTPRCGVRGGDPRRRLASHDRPGRDRLADRLPAEERTGHAPGRVGRRQGVLARLAPRLGSCVRRRRPGCSRGEGPHPP